MSLPDGPLNSPKPTNSILVGATHNITPPAPGDGQVCALQVDDQGNLLVNVAVGGGSGSSNVNIADVNGNPPALTNPLPVELSDGTNAFGTAGNPLSVNVLSGGAPTGTATVEVAGIIGTSTVTVAGGVAASITGTATVTVAGNVTVVGAAASGAAASGNPVLVAGIDGVGKAHDLLVSTTRGMLVVVSNDSPAVDGLPNNQVNFFYNNNDALAAAQVGPLLFNGTTWDRSRSGSVLGATMVQVTSTPTVNIAGLFTAQTNTTTITASSTLAVAAATRWEVKAIVFRAICSNTVTKQAAVWITDASGNVIWETQGPVVTPTNTLCLEHTIYPAVTSQTTYTPLVRGTNTSVIVLSMPDLVLGASFTINATMVGAAATQTYTLCVNAIIE